MGIEFVDDRVQRDQGVGGELLMQLHETPARVGFSATDVGPAAHEWHRASPCPAKPVDLDPNEHRAGAAGARRRDVTRGTIRAASGRRRHAG